MEHLTFDFKPDLPVHYAFQKARYDCEHLLIVMSGFNVPDPTVYDFNMLQHCRSAILWIKDDFNRLPAYYLCRGMKFDVEQGVSALIEAVISHIKPKSVSIMGGSKGGTAALYYGIKHKLKNIISLVPQFKIGSYVTEGHWAQVGKEMMGNVTLTNRTMLDSLLPHKIKSDRQLDRNIYLFSSTEDKQFLTEVEPNLPLFEKYENFNLIMSKSPCVTQHIEVTAYNINLILSLIYQFEAEIAPRWGKIENGSLRTR
ncbi:hypothetical protein CIG19_18395 [Enterobacterales bacterium CwR94]|nr:hypothetical protein CIG19_18395 [Enterobacterales bacterium CwR94]